MPAKKTTEQKEAKKATRKRAETTPSFPYTTKPGSLRRLLADIPKKPKPPKYTEELLAGWGFRDGNDYSMIRVLKSVGMLNPSNEPTDDYTKFMDLQRGSTAMAPKLREVYKPLFNASHEPWNESAETLQNYFNIHSGGSQRCLEHQIQTFKVLTEFTTFGEEDPASGLHPAPSAARQQAAAQGASPAIAQGGGAGININVHIHLPENKSRRDYECMIEDIGRYIFGREPRDARDER